MTSATTTLPVETVVVNAGQAAQPRKRRRRTAATGAADDCFTCRKRSIKCDRKRPYCTQCLEIGQDCSGYQTKLTWGVGVASRGKLRGLSLPIANSTKKASADDSNEQATSAPKCDVFPTSNPDQLQRTISRESTASKFHHSGRLSASLYSSGHFHHSSPISIPTSEPQGVWSSVDFGLPFESYNSFVEKPVRMPLRPNPLRRIRTAPPHPYEESVYSTPSSAFSDSDYPSPRDFPATPEDYSLPEPYVGSYSESYPCPPEQLHSADLYGFGQPPRSFPGNTSFSMPSMHDANSSMNDFELLPSSSTSFVDLLQCHTFAPTNEMAQSYAGLQNMDQDCFSDGFSDFSVSHVPPSWPAPKPTDLPGFRALPLPTRLFLESFDKTICPLLVAVDDRRNPYRVHLLSSISESMPLQYAMAALVISQTKRRSSSEHSAASTSCAIESIADDTDYRLKATDAFNTALKHPHAVSTDSILMALLMLCLLSLSETGFGKFKVGITGVRRLLAARNNVDQVQSTLAKWAIQWFIWLDIIASATSLNDEDPTPFFEMLHTSACLGSLEYVANGEGRLFETVARLAGWFISSNRMTPSKDFYGHSPTDLAGFELQHSSTFWAPLQVQVHKRLKSYANHPNFHSHEADPAIMEHLETAFRHAAAIYAEKHSALQQDGTSAVMQILVADALSSIAAIPANSCISQFLLWPLLIVGVECVSSGDRETIRARVSTSTNGLLIGGSNCIDVLARVWLLLDTGCVESFPTQDADYALHGLNVLGARAGVWRQALTALNSDMSSG